MPRATHHLTLSMSPLCVLSRFVSFQRPGYHFWKYGKLLLWWQYQATEQYSSSSFPSQIVMPAKSYLAWRSHRINLIIKGLRSVQEHEPHVTSFGTQGTSEIHLHEISRFWRSSKSGVPKQKCAPSSLFHEGRTELVHREKDQLFSLIFQLSVRSIRVTFLEGVQETSSGSLICICPRRSQSSINPFYFTHWQEVLMLLLKMRSGCRTRYQHILGTMFRWPVGKISPTCHIDRNSDRKKSGLGPGH